eukprot:COSAG06_NODE_34088_length_480_cov_0.490814_1_plen_40_part_10
MADAAKGELLTKFARLKYGAEVEAAKSLSIQSSLIHSSVH